MRTLLGENNRHINFNEWSQTMADQLYPMVDFILNYTLLILLHVHFDCLEIGNCFCQTFLSQQIRFPLLELELRKTFTYLMGNCLPVIDMLNIFKWNCIITRKFVTIAEIEPD